MPLSLDHVYDICLVSDTKGGCCRYLSQDNASLQYQCLKKTNFKDEIDDEVKTKKGNEPNIAQGDNCKGYPVFHQLIVGYDQKTS